MSTGLFFAMPSELGNLFYNRNDLGNIIFSLSFGVIFIYIESTLFGILNGLGKQGILLRNTLIMSSVDVILLYILIGIPEINIYGYAIDFVVSPLIGCILNSYEIWKITDMSIDFNEILIFPISITILEIIVIKKTKYMVLSLLGSAYSSTIALLIIGIVFFTLIFYIINTFFKKTFR
jgi:stage V sporulation protein B